MGLIEKLFGSREIKYTRLPALLEPKDPVNYDSVLDWMVGLSETDYKRMCQVITIYRDADTRAAVKLGVPITPTAHIKPKKLTGKQIDSGLDDLLETNTRDLRAAVKNHRPKSKRRKASANK